MLFLLSLCSLFFNTIVGRVYTIPNTISQEPTDLRWNSGFELLDSQKILPRPNGTSYEWWYFDVVSTTSTNESIVVVFFEATGQSFPGIHPNTSLQVGIWVSYENGTFGRLPLVNQAGEAGAALITEEYLDVNGTWQTTGASFASYGGGTRYLVKLENPARGIEGTITFERRAPPHYPCEGALPFQNQEVSPHVGWSNALPDADATVNVIINGTQLAFSGLGYHDKNWGDVPFRQEVDTWYWGHARFGPYSIVWFDVLHPSGYEYISSYVSENGEIVASSCMPGSLVARPAGRNSEYPPIVNVTGHPEMFNIEIDMGVEGHLNVQVTNRMIIADAGDYIRYIGPVEASLSSKNQTFTGTALTEQFRFRTAA